MTSDITLYLHYLAKRNFAKKELRDIPTEELEDLVKDYIEKTKDKKFDSLSLVFEPLDSDNFMAFGAFDVIKERKGEDYALWIIGLRKPRNLKEYIYKLIVGKYPKLYSSKHF